MLMIAAMMAATQTQASLNQRVGSDCRAADARLNAQYRETMAVARRNDAVPAPDAKGRPSYQQALLSAQRAWIAYRDANCTAFGYQYRGGSAEGMARGACLTTVTDVRTAELRRLARAWTAL